MMDRQLRRPAREAQRVRPATYAGPRNDARAAGPDERMPGALRELLGQMFSTPKDLRHIAEQHFGELFVPTEVLADSPHQAVLMLRTQALGPVMVHAERARHWYPFRVTRVEAPRAVADSRPGRAEPRPRANPYRATTRPRIDWL